MNVNLKLPNEAGDALEHFVKNYEIRICKNSVLRIYEKVNGKLKRVGLWSPCHGIKAGCVLNIALLILEENGYRVAECDDGHIRAWQEIAD